MTRIFGKDNILLFQLHSNHRQRCEQRRKGIACGDKTWPLCDFYKFTADRSSFYGVNDL